MNRGHVNEATVPLESLTREDLPPQPERLPASTAALAILAMSLCGWLGVLAGLHALFG